MSAIERLKNKKVSGGGLPKLPKPTKPLVLAVSAVTHAAHLKLSMVASEVPTPCQHPNQSPDPLRFTVTSGKGGTVLGQTDDTPASLLADLIERWPGELPAACQGTKQIWP